MLLELGPLAADDVRCWARFTRRMICEFRVDPGDLAGVATPDFLSEWQSLVDAWDAHAAQSETFRWSSHLDIELAGYLLHGFDRCVQSAAVKTVTTTEERSTYAAFTFHVMQSFVDGLAGQDSGHDHLVDQIRCSIGAQLDH